MRLLRDAVNWAGVALAAVLLAGPAMACQSPGGADAMRGQVVDWINAERQTRGLRPLQASVTLQKSATSHACDMAERGFFAHTGPGGPSFVQRLRKTGYRYRAANENIAMTSSSSVAQVTLMWRDSPSHLKNVLDPKVREVGVGLAQVGDQVFWVTNSGDT